MPFTFAHAAAALPFRCTRLILSALLIGSFAPDLRYFLAWAPVGHYGHTLPGAFLFDLPLSLVLFWLFENYVRQSTITLLPNALQSRLTEPPPRYRLTELRTFALVSVSILIGTLTHIIWDSFTHPGLWPSRHWPALNQSLHVPILGPTHYYKLAQHGSSLFGTLLVFVWMLYWYSATRPDPNFTGGPIPRTRRIAIVLLMLAAALAGGLLRAYTGGALAGGRRSIAALTGETVVTFVALLWWELLAYGFLVRKAE